jgi:hypothetical protein
MGRDCKFDVAFSWFMNHLLLGNTHLRCILWLRHSMAIDRNKIEDLVELLPKELQNEVLRFSESPLHRKDDTSDGNGTPPVRSFFGIWDSGNPRAGDNTRIDADLARKYASWQQRKEA